jgi:biotin carboxylase
VPLVTKPADGAGSTGVTVLTDPSRTRAAWDAARHAGAASPRGRYGTPTDRRVVVQEHVHGAEYSVESITQHGHTTHLCVTRKTTTGGPHRVEVGHSLPAVLQPATRRRLLAEADAAIHAVGIRNGASHTELILTSDGRPVVLEIGARIAAGHIGTLIQHALGIDPWRALLDVAVGRPAALAATRNRYAAVRFITAPVAGTLIAITGLPHGEPHVHDIRVRVAVGDHVEPAAGNGARLGSFIVTGTDPQRVDERADAFTRRINVAVDDKAANQISADSTAAISS